MHLVDHEMLLSKSVITVALEESVERLFYQNFV
jgi:hypothetical protein